jgi:hypothetical protein
MVKDLIKVATKLDSLGLTREASYLDSIIRKIAGEGGEFSGDPEWSEHMKRVKIVMDRTGLSEDEAEDLLMRVDMENEFGPDHGPLGAHDREPMETSYNPHVHGIPSYEMDTDSIHEGIDSDRELEEMYPTETSFRRSSSNKRGMRKRS